MDWRRGEVVTNDLKVEEQPEFRERATLKTYCSLADIRKYSLDLPAGSETTVADQIQIIRIRIRIVTGDTFK